MLRPQRKNSNPYLQCKPSFRVRIEEKRSRGTFSDFESLLIDESIIFSAEISVLSEMEASNARALDLASLNVLLNGRLGNRKMSAIDLPQ